MKVIWEMGAASVKNVYAMISKRKPTAYTTILTIMGILESKGALTHTKSGRAFIYRPVLTKQQATCNHVHDIVDRFFDGNPDKLIANIHSNTMKEASGAEQDVRLGDEQPGGKPFIPGPLEAIAREQDRFKGSGP